MHPNRRQAVLWLLVTCIALLVTPQAFALSPVVPQASFTITQSQGVDLWSVPDGQGCRWVTEEWGYVESSDGILPVDVNDLPFGSSTVLLEGECADGSYRTLLVEFVVPFRLSMPAVVAPDADQVSKPVVTVRAPTAVRVTVLRNGKTVKSARAADGSVEVTLPITRKNSKGRWKVRVESDGQVTDVPVPVARGWAPLGDEVARFPRCSTVTWRLESKGQPKRAAGIERDVVAALEQLSAATGLTFQKASPDKDADLTYSWANLTGVAGMGGYRVSGSPVDYTIRGTVELSKSSSWLGIPGFKTSAGKLPGRGVLILHETMHALGLGHVVDKGQVMFPVTRPSSPWALAPGDREGLRWLYQPQECPAA